MLQLHYFCNIINMDEHFVNFIFIIYNRDYIIISSIPVFNYTYFQANFSLLNPEMHYERIHITQGFERNELQHQTKLDVEI